MAMHKRAVYYIGLIMILGAVIFLAYVIYMGPHTKIPETTVTILYDHPEGPRLEDIEPGDILELSFKSTKPVNVLLMKGEDSGDYFNNPSPTVVPVVLAEESTGGYFEYEFESPGTWKVYFQNPTPPPRTEPVVKYWGQLVREDDSVIMHYLNITTSVIFIIIGIIFVFISMNRSKKQTTKNAKNRLGKKKAKKRK